MLDKAPEDLVAEHKPSDENDSSLLHREGHDETLFRHPLGRRLQMARREGGWMPSLPRKSRSFAVSSFDNSRRRSQ